jgi:actin related protein 2/3 complex, subunit 5
MTKNTNASGFRKVDVDAFTENDNYDDDKNEVNELGPNEKEVKQLLDGKRNVDALQLVLKSAPISTRNQKIKVKSSHAVNLITILNKYHLIINRTMRFK